jgi:flagellar biosynthetic protein FlhB
VAEDEDQESKTEAPSGKRLSDAYKQGNVAMSRDTVMAAVTVAGGISLLVFGGAMGDSLLGLVRSSLVGVAEPNPRDFVELLRRPAKLTVMVCGLAALAGLVATAAQTRLGFWPDKVMPDLSRVFAGGKFGQMFNKEALGNLGLTAVKIVTLGAALWWSFRDEFVALPRMLQLGPDGLLAALFRPVAGALVKVMAALVFLAGLDLAVMHLRFRKRMRMSKEELKREAKDDEGDPAYKGKRRRRHRELIRGRIAVEVPKADVLVVNPTHVAVALRYRADEDRAPRVTAKGMGEKAEKMRALARDNGVPIVQNVPLARLLYRRVKVGRAVPAETFKAVAAILAFVYKALGRTGGGAPSREAQL